MLKELQLDDNAPWKQRYHAPAILWSQLARSVPARGLVVSDKSGKSQLYAWDVPSGKLRQLTDRPEGVLFGFISPDGRHVYYLQDKGGNEIGHYVRLPFEGGEPEDITPEMPPYSSFGFNMSRAGNFIGLNIVNAEGFHVFGLKLEQGNIISAPRKLYHSRKLVFGPVLSHGGEIGVVGSTQRTTVQHFSLLAFDTARSERIAELWDGEGASLQPIGFAPLAGDFRFLASANRTGVVRPVIWNPCSGERIDMTLPELTGDVSPVDWSPDGKRILVCQFNQAVQQLAVYDLTTNRLTRLAHPGGTFGFFAGLGTYFASNSEIFGQWQDSTHPSQLIALDSWTGRKQRTVLAARDVPPCHPWRHITFISSDGQMIQGWLSLPDGEGPFPAILHTHGGPEAVMTENFVPSSQAWVDHGFAFLTINYRGSIGFGREFREKIWGNLGHWEIEDMVAAREWLVNEGIARPDQILLIGWSYGGYLTLLALGKRPDLWAGGMAGIAVADWATDYEDEAETLKGYSVAMFGGTPQEKPEQYAASSPITYAENVRAPVLIIQGRNDTRTPPRQIEIYETRMKAMGKPIEVHWFDAGHLGTGVDQEILHQELMLRFAYRVLG